MQPERYSSQTLFKDYYVDKYGPDFALVEYCNCKEYDMDFSLPAIRVLINRRNHVEEMGYSINFIQVDLNK